MASLGSPFVVDEDEARWAACIADAEAGCVLPLDVHAAASLGDDEVVTEAVHSDPSLALARNDLGWSPLMYAVWQGQEALVAVLLEASRRCGQDAADGAVGRLPRSGRTLLMVAARFGYLRIATRLVQAKSLERRDFRGQTALFHAIRGGNEDLIRMLVESGANVNACDLQGCSVLRLAERCRPAATCQRLRAAGARREAVAAPRPSASAASTSRAPEGPLHSHLTLADVLEGLSLQKYVALFKLHDIDLHAFLAMTEDDLRRVGVSLLGPRRKMSMEIERLQYLFNISRVT